MTYDIIFIYQRGTMKFGRCSRPLPITELYNFSMKHWSDIYGPLKTIKIFFHE